MRFFRLVSFQVQESGRIQKAEFSRGSGEIRFKIKTTLSENQLGRAGLFSISSPILTFYVWRYFIRPGNLSLFMFNLFK